MNAENMDRRNFLKTCAFTTGAVGLSLEEKTLLAQFFPSPSDPFAKLQMAIDAGAHGAFIQGEMGDRLTQQGRLDLVAKVVEHARKNGLVAGVACHTIEVPISCEKAGIPVDFYMKTLTGPNRTRPWHG